MLKPLSSKEVKEIKKIIKRQWACEPELNYQFLQTEKGKIYVVTRDIAHVDFKQLNVKNLGMYFGKLKDDSLRLSIEGSQLVGPHATKNVVELKKDEVTTWITGNIVEKQGNWENFVIIKKKNDFLGTGRYGSGKIFNFVPKSRRLQVVH